MPIKLTPIVINAIPIHFKAVILSPRNLIGTRPVQMQPTDNKGNSTERSPPLRARINNMLLTPYRKNPNMSLCQFSLLQKPLQYDVFLPHACH